MSNPSLTSQPGELVENSKILQGRVQALPKEGSGVMSSALRCLQAMELLAEDPFVYGVAEVAEALEVPRPTAHRILATLVAAGLVEQEVSTRGYRLAPKALWVGSGYLRHSALYRAAFFPIRDLSRQVDGTVQLGVEDRDTVLFIHAVGSPPIAQSYADVGLRRPLHATATGKVILAQWSDEQVSEYMRFRACECTPRTILSPEKMREELAGVREKGYAVNMEELLVGVAVLAAPVFQQDGRVAGGISVLVSAAKMTPQLEQEYVALLQEASIRASRQLGHPTGMYRLRPH
jgi:DNA-binding IclR family transcriptional regulator